MAARYCVFVLTGVLLFATRLTPDGNGAGKAELIVWNTGQGQWVTVVDENGCWHFDMGGEKAPWAAVRALCRERVNRLSISHWDWDHLSFTERVRQHLPDTCLLLPPLGAASPRKQRALRALKPCDRSPPFASWVDEQGRSANDLSRVIWWQGVLVPGDSTIKEEKIWLSALHTNLSQTRILILGHHGSRTSTSRQLLSQLPHLRAAVASARQRKYGHPHLRVQQDLLRYQIPLLRTEEWGNLHFAL